MLNAATHDCSDNRPVRGRSLLLRNASERRGAGYRFPVQHNWTFA